MGVERAVTRWYLQRQIILDEIALLEAMLRQEPSDQADKKAGSEEVMQKLLIAQEKLRVLGPCPKPMMG